MGYVNRFLAHCSFEEHQWSRITHAKVTAHDAMLNANLEAGTVSRILQTILDFWDWVRSERLVRRLQFEKMGQSLIGCLKSTQKDVARRNTAR